METYLTGAQMRAADLYTIETIGIPSLVLMERAALGVVEAIEEQKLPTSDILVVCGAGNNGGDGYAIARLLHLKGYSTSLYFLGKEASRSSENQLQERIAKHYQIPVVNELEDQYSLIIDAVFGTGLKRNLEGMYYDTVERFNQMSGCKLAVDLPSGIQDETGMVMGTAFRADCTVSIAFHKRGVLLQPGNQYAGKLICKDIGITEEAIDTKERIAFGYQLEDLKALYPKRRKNTHKGSYGKVLMIVGSKGMSGAAYLSAKAAYAAGAGLVQIYTAEENRAVLQQLLPEAIVTTYESFEPERVKELIPWADTIAIGSGLGMSSTAEQMVKCVMENAQVPCVIDADALNLLAQHLEWFELLKAEAILTPHMKEMTRLIGRSMQELQENRVELTGAFVKNKNVTCVLKDARTIVENAQENLYINVSGNAAMAKAGSGDVLTGIVAGIAGQGTMPFQAACLGTYLHGLAGDAAKCKKGSHSVLASDIIDGIGDVLKTI